MTDGLYFPLLEDGSLLLRTDAASRTQVSHWLPKLPAAARSDDARPTATLTVALRDGVPDRPSGSPTMMLGPIEAWIAEAGDRVALRSRDGAVTGEVDLAHPAATIGLSAEAARPVASEVEPRNAAVFSALTLAAALLLNRMRRALLHAAAVVAPDGEAWLLVGDAFTGKTTTTVNLIREGWDYVSDDHVVLGRAPGGGVVVEGWPRAFHLDRGYRSGASVGERDPVDPAEFGPGGWRRSAPLRGALFPTVAAELPTVSEPIAAADALARLIRQSPWLLADRVAVRDVLALLADAVAGPVLALRLGRDSYGDGGVVAGVVPDSSPVTTGPLPDVRLGR